MSALRHRYVWLLTGLLFAGVAGCHDDNDRKVRYRHERPAERRTRVDVTVNEPERRAVVEPGESDVIVEAEPPVVIDEPDRVIIARRRPTIVVHEVPPTVIVERRPPPPSRVHIWVEGHWRHDGHRFVWAQGRYEKVHRGKHYVQPRWIHTERGWALYEGHWD